MDRMTRFAALLVVAITLAAAPTNAQDSKGPSVQEQVATLLDGIESEPTNQQWEAIGTSAIGELAAIVSNPKQKVVRRGRAITALASFPGVAAEAVVRTTLEDPKSPSLLKRKAMISLATLSGDRAIDAIKPHLGDDSARMREAAVDALSQIGTSTARELLKLRLAAEKKEHIREKLRAALAKPAKLTIESVGTESTTIPETSETTTNQTPKSTPSSGTTVEFK